MKLENINEVEKLIIQFRKIKVAKKAIGKLSGEAESNNGHFMLTDLETGVDICLHDIKDEVLEAIDMVLNVNYDRISAELRKL